MDDLISKAEAQTELMLAARRYTVAHEAHGEGRVVWSDNLISVSDAVDVLRKLPSAHRPVDERKHGEWIVYENQRQEDVDNGNYLYVCSECGKSDIHAKTQKVPFCWWCGARMDGDENA